MVAASKESGDYEEPGGGEHYKMEVMQDELAMTPDCSDQDPGYCFQVPLYIGYCFQVPLYIGYCHYI